jgi:hypothetical protein
MKTALLSLLIYASLSCAQPWQWEQYQGTFWHQASDEIPWLEASGLWEYNYANVVSGDFNGNGRDEVRVGFDFYETDEDSTLQYWNRTFVGQLLIGVDEVFLYMQAVNLDDDPRDELLVYSRLENQPHTPFVRAYDSEEHNPHTFTERPDVIESLAFPGFPAPCMFGNFDGDSLLDGFVLTNNGLEFYERENNAWSLRETFENFTYSDMVYYLAADVNSDGYMEIGIYYPGIDCNCMFGYILDYVEGQGVVENFTDNVLLFPGDYDGDGNTESFLDGLELSLPSTLVRLSSGDPFTSTELANQWEANSPVVYSINRNGENHVYSFYNGQRFMFGPWILVPAGYSLEWSDSVWTRAGNGYSLGHVYEGNTADIDGDGQREYIYLNEVADLWNGGTKEVWSMGSGNFSTFYDNEDTLFTMPRIGDVEGDGVGELVTRVASGAPVGLYFFELERVGNEVTAHYQPHLSDGLPTNFTEYTLADIDNDGHAELFINTGYWRSFFWRNGRWNEYTGILPTGIGLNLYFADFDNDGDLDVFTQNGVWLSLTPSPVNDQPILHPSSFILSAFPNPFNAETTLQFDLPQTGLATLKIYDVLGREVTTLLNEVTPAGTHVLHYNAAQLSSGVYFAKLESNHESITHKLLLLK